MEHEMASESEARFAAYVEDLSTALGHADRTGPLRGYCLGLLMPVERKSVEPMAAGTAPAHVAAQHQSLLHFVGQGGWSDNGVLSAQLGDEELQLSFSSRRISASLRSTVRVSRSDTISA